MEIWNLLRLVIVEGKLGVEGYEGQCLSTGARHASVGRVNTIFDHKEGSLFFKLPEPGADTGSNKIDIPCLTWLKYAEVLL